MRPSVLFTSLDKEVMMLRDYLQCIFIHTYKICQIGASFSDTRQNITNFSTKNKSNKIPVVITFVQLISQTFSCHLLLIK